MQNTKVAAFFLKQKQKQKQKRNFRLRMQNTMLVFVY